MATILAAILVLLAGVPAAEKPPETPSASQTAGAAEGAKAPAAETSREAKRRAARALARFSWIELGRPEHRWVGEPISLSLRDADLVEVLRSFAKMVDVNLVIDPGVAGKVTVELHDVPWDQALYVILKSHGLGMEISGNMWSMMPAEKLAGDD